MSLRWITPSSRSSLATASGVPPARAMRSAIARCAARAGGSDPPAFPTASRKRPVAACAASHRRALADREPSRSTPLIRVCAEKGTNCGVERAPSRGRACRTSPWPGRRSSGPPASRRRARRAAPHRRARRSSTPGTAMNSVACRLPSVIVPVLSSSSMSTSPAASTARPDMASTLKRTSRSMPAMPMADSSAPMVVGIKVDEQRDQDDDRDGAAGVAAKLGIVTVAKTKMIVMPASRMLSAISFGVFCRTAPSTSAIMRSRKVEPWLAVIRTLSQSESDPRAAGDRRAVAAALADDRRRFAGDRRFVDRGDALDHLAVARDHVAGLDQHEVAELERSAATCSKSAHSAVDEQLGLGLGAGAGAGCRPGPCRGLPPPPRRNWRTGP